MEYRKIPLLREFGIRNIFGELSIGGPAVLVLVMPDQITHVADQRSSHFACLRYCEILHTAPGQNALLQQPLNKRSQRAPWLFVRWSVVFRRVSRMYHDGVIFGRANRFRVL